MKDQIVISSAIILPILKLCSALDISSELLESHINKLDLSNIEESGLPAEEVLNLVDALYTESGRDDLGFLLGDIFEFEYTPEFTTFLNSVSNLRELLESANWLGQFFSSNLQLSYEQGIDSSSLFFPPREAYSLLVSDKLYRTIIEGVFTYVLKQARKLYGPDIHVCSVNLSFPDPQISESYAHYFTVPYHFNAQRNEIVVPRELLERPLQGGIPALNQKARECLMHKLERIQSSQSATQQILQLLQTNPDLLGCGVTTIAEKIHVGERTLQRRLKKEGTNFFNLQDKAKSRLAIEMLTSNRFTIEQISDKLGFSDRRSFSRAFQRWQGCTPSQFRETEE